MAYKNSARKSRFTPRAKTAHTTSERSYPLSLLLVGVSAVLTLAVASWLGLLANGKDVSLEIKEVKRAESGEVQLTGARYRGLTPAGKPYEITAVKANEAPDGSGRVNMDQPTAVLIMRDGSLIKLQSNSGIFNKQTDIVSNLIAIFVLIPKRSKLISKLVKCIAMLRFRFRIWTGASMPIACKPMRMVRGLSLAGLQK